MRMKNSTSLPESPPTQGASRKPVFCTTCGGKGSFKADGPTGQAAWVCNSYPTCDSYVGVYKGSRNALGTLAGPSLRTERANAHVWIDRIWRKDGGPSRKTVYEVISATLGVKYFHVAKSDLKLLELLDQKRPLIESSLLETVPLASDGMKTAAPASSQLSEAHKAVSQIDRSLYQELFGKKASRTWPTDPGGRAAAARCVQLGYAAPYLDGSGRRAITKTQNFPAME